MPEPPAAFAKFVQITATGDPPRQLVLALDAEGRVYQYIGGTRRQPGQVGQTNAPWMLEDDAAWRQLSAARIL